VCYVRQSEMVPSSPASSPAVCISWAKSRPRLQADALGTLVVAGQRRPPCTSSGRATLAEWLSSTHQATCHEYFRILRGAFAQNTLIEGPAGPR
jgi:hypothetical protein